ncbi:MAG TPA: hypothetical protein VKK79_01645 [Candidatus Lokiarchaeia archaeon]|nr:hypothetical protein [Candidatus Lokiarchaeia archaeon]
MSGDATQFPNTVLASEGVGTHLSAIRFLGGLLVILVVLRNKKLIEVSPRSGARFF